MSKSESQALYGIAILCMLFHHLFLNMDPQNYFSVFNEIIGINVIGTIAKLCKICVPIYAFITGYGFSEASKINVGGGIILARR